MGNYDESYIFENREQEEDSNNDANLEMAENISSDKDNISDIGSNNNIFDLNPRGELTSSFCEREIFENREFRGFFQDIEPEKFSNIFLQQNLELSNHDHIFLYSVKQNHKSNSKEMIQNDDLSDISNIHKTVINSVLADDLTTASSLRKPCSLDDIRNILRKNKISENIVEKIKDCASSLDRQNVGYFEVKVKGTRQRNREKMPVIKELKLIGRKRKEDDIEGKHNRNDTDNIIKKCKVVLFKYVVLYVLEIVNRLRTNKEENFELLKLSYEYIDKLKKKNEQDLFKRAIKDLVSLETSSKYSSNKDKDFNKKNINKILILEKDNKALIDLLNMSFGDWIDVFTLKTNIENSTEFKGIEEALKNISDKNDDEYFSRFIFYLFNYQNYFNNKKGRKPKTKKNNKKKLNLKIID